MNSPRDSSSSATAADASGKQSERNRACSHSSVDRRGTNRQQPGRIFPRSGSRRSPAAIRRGSTAMPRGR